MKTEELTISIAQFADGTLPDAERTRVEALLENHAELQSLYAEEQSLTALLRSDPLPNLDWDKLASRFSSAVDDGLQEHVDRASWAMRFQRATSYFGARGMVAAAASFIIGLGLTTYMMRPGPTPIADNLHLIHAGIDHPAPPTSVALVVDGPQEDRPIGRAVEEISIGPGGTYATASAPSPYSEEISARPARVMIAAEAPPEQASSPAAPF